MAPSAMASGGDSQEIEAKQASLAAEECDGNLWHFVINQLEGTIAAPKAINVTWEGQPAEEVPLDKVVSSPENPRVAHYETASNPHLNVTGASTTIDAAWSGQFVLSDGPCPDGVPPQEAPTLEVLKTPDGDEVDAEDQFNWTIQVINSGTVDAENVTVNDTIPQGLLPFGARASQGDCDVVLRNVTCDLGTIPAGNSATVTITVLATGEECGRVDNLATVDAESPEGNQTTEQDTGHVHVVCADASVNKTARQASVPLGDDVVFDIVVTAHGPNASENVTLTDQLPDLSGGWTLSGDNATDCTIDASDELTCDFGAISAGQVRSITLSGATGDGADCGTYRNTATIDSNLDLDDTKDADSADATVVCPDGEPELSIDKTPDEGFATAGDTFNWTITVTNHGPGTARDVNVTDIVDANLTIVSVTDPCTVQQQLVTCELGDLAENTSRVLEIQVRAPTGDAVDCRRYQNTAAVEASNEVDPDALDNTDRGHLTVECPDITVEKTPDGGTAHPGGNVTWTTTVINNGPGNATDVHVNDTIDTEIVDMRLVATSPASIPVTCQGDVPRGEFNCTIPVLPEGESLAIEHEVTLSEDPCDVVTNVANVSASNELSGNTSDNSDTAHVTCEDGEPEPRIEKTPSSATVIAGDDFTWNVTVKNLGNGTAHDVQITDIVDDGLAIRSVSPTPACSFSGQTMVCDVGSLAPGANFTAQLTVSTSTERCDETFKNTATVTWADGASTASFDSETDFAFLTVECVPTQEEPTLEITKTPDGGDVHVGDPFNWTLTVINSGSVDAENVTVNDTIPTGLDVLSASADQGSCSVSGQDVTCDLGTVPAGQDAVVEIRVVADGDACGPVTNTGIADADGSPSGDLSDDGQVTVLCPDAKVTKSATDASISPGGTAEYTIAVENLGPGNATNVTLTDPLPGDGWTLSGADASDCQPFDGDSLDCDFGTLEDGDTRTVSVSRTVTSPADCAGLQNTATVSTPGDTNSTNDRDSATIAVNCVPTEEEPTLEVEKTPDGGTVQVGEVFDWTIRVINGGTVDAENVTLDDSVPAGLDVLGVSPGSPTCTLTGNDVHCELGTLPGGQETTVTVTVQANGEACGRVVNTGVADADGSPQGDLSDTGHVDVDCPDEERYMTAHRPFQDPPGEVEPYLKERGLFVDRFNATNVSERLGLGETTRDVANASVRVYGQVHRTAPDVYEDASQVFDPRAIPSGSITFNPAILQHTDPGVGTIRGCDGDADLKKHLRVWYEPGHTFEGPRVESGDYTPTEGDVIQVESTYQLVDSSSLQPTTGCAASEGGAQFPFPTEGVHRALDDGHQQPGLDTMTSVRLGNVSEGTTTEGTVELERQVTLETGESIQFLDHRFTFENVVTDLDGDTLAQLETSYLGNTFETSIETIDVAERVYLTRDNREFGTALHNAGSDTRTSYVQVTSFGSNEESATLIVGKEIQAGDAFYVDGVRYDVPAVTTEGGELAHLTLRTPLPKSDPEGSWTSVTEPTREEELDPSVPEGTGTWQVQDNSHVTTQWLVETDWTDPIPVDPPFNHETYTMVDDTDVQLWEPRQNAISFPYGPPESSLPGGDGQPMFPEGERYLTMEDPPQAWKTFFDVTPTGYADSIENRLAEDVPGINHDAWQPGLEGPPTFAHENVTFFWVQEWIEDRVSKNLLELPEDGAFTFDDRGTLPDRHTSFVLPDRPNPSSKLSATLAFASPCSRSDVVPGGQDCQRDVDLLGGDYLVTTSLRLQDASTRHAFTHVPRMSPNSLDRFDLYFNEVDIEDSFGPDRPIVADTTVRLYGEHGEGNHAPSVYDEASDPFDPSAIPKDSATFNPAIIRHTDPDAGTITACGEDAHLKKRLRVFYAPGHTYDGPRVDGTAATVADAVEVESTYGLLDASSYKPVTGCPANGASTRFPFPTSGAHLAPGDGHEQPGVDQMETVRLGNVSTGSSPQGTVELERNVRLSLGESVQFLDHVFELDDLVQTVPSDEASVQLSIGYTGNYQGFSAQTQTHDVRDRVYVSRANDAFGTPAHEAGSFTRTSYVELSSFDADDETATITVGKELAAGDVFYVDGVRYEVPAVVTQDGELRSITLRTPIPKSDPGGSWTSVTDPTREQEINGQWQVEDGSHVTSQWLVEADHGDPIPVDPPFNQETYQMVDDVDVQLWEPTQNAEHFPWGPPNSSLPGGNGLPMFPQGERYLTVADPPSAWTSFFGAVRTGYLDEGQSYADDTPQRIDEAEGINHEAWSSTGTDTPPEVREENATFYWAKEWLEGRYSTNLLEIREGEAFVGRDVETLPDRYTAFVLPDRPNPASSLLGTLEIASDPSCTRGDLVNLDTCQRTVPLLGGDYAIVTSFVEPGPNATAAGTGSAGTSDVHAFDQDADCVLSDLEVLQMVAAWGRGNVDDTTLLEGVAAWGKAPGRYC